MLLRSFFWRILRRIVEVAERARVEKTASLSPGDLDDEYSRGVFFRLANPGMRSYALESFAARIAAPNLFICEGL